MSEMRLQRALAQAGVASRRAAEELITAGKVRVNGKVATLGSKVDPGHPDDHGAGAGHPKPRAAGWRSTSRSASSPPPSDEEGRRTVFDLIDDPKGLTYVGRLDVMTTGLLLLTTDGDAVHRLTHPRYRIERQLHRAGARAVHRGDRARRSSSRSPSTAGRWCRSGPGPPRRPGPQHPRRDTDRGTQSYRAALVRGDGPQGRTAGPAVLRSGPPR